MHCADLGESFPTSIYYLLSKFGFDTAENEPCKVCPISAYRSPRFCMDCNCQDSGDAMPCEMCSHEKDDDHHGHDHDDMDMGSGYGYGYGLMEEEI